MNLHDLNPQQREAVLHRGSPLLVLAGAGSGKTRVITRRIAHLLHTDDAQPSQILAVTFTNRAANEMKERVATLVGSSRTSDLTLSTFHSFCAKLLRKEIHPLGYTNRFTIYDVSDQRTLLTRCLSEFSLGGERFDIGIFQYRISRAKNKGLTPEDYEPFRHDKYDERLPSLWKAYQEALLARNALDFDDLLYLVLRLFREHPDVLERTRKRFAHILIDEYQDTNLIQFEIARLLAEKHRNLCVVGDDDQSIYGWRGAEVSNILEFEKYFPDARIITLEQNYRSTETILNASNAVISRNSNRKPKRLWSQLGRGAPIEVVTAQDETDEAEFVTRTIQEMRKAHQLKWSDFGVLYRSNIQSRPFEMNLRQNRVPYVVVGGIEFFDRREVKDVASYLRVIANPRDEVSLLRILNVPRRGIGDSAIRRLNEAARERRKPLWEILKQAEDLRLSDSANHGIGSFLQLIRQTSRLVRDRGLSEAISYLIHRSGYLDEIKRTSPNEAASENRKQIVLELVNAADAYERQSESSSLIGFLEHASLVNDYRQNRMEGRYGGDTVRLMTLHSAKGLEFPVVFLVGVEEGLLPHTRSVGLDNEVHEERRLFYVGMTRARQRLFLTTTTLRTVRGRPKPTTDSRFLAEIPDDLVRYVETCQIVQS